MFEVQTLFTYGWENCWTEDDVLLQFNTREEAQAALDDLFNSVKHLDYSKSDYRIVETKRWN